MPRYDKYHEQPDSIQMMLVGFVQLILDQPTVANSLSLSDGMDWELSFRVYVF